jgi:hypothetical protein
VAEVVGFRALLGLIFFTHSLTVDRLKQRICQAIEATQALIITASRVLVYDFIDKIKGRLIPRLNGPSTSGLPH